MSKPNSTVTHQTAALGVIVLVIGVAGSVEQRYLALLPGAVLMVALMALAGVLVHKSYHWEEVGAPDIYDAEIDTEEIARKLVEARQFMSPEEWEKFMRSFAALRKKKAAHDADTSRTAGRKTATKTYRHHTRREGQCQV